MPVPKGAWWKEKKGRLGKGRLSTLNEAKEKARKRGPGRYEIDGFVLIVAEDGRVMPMGKTK